MKSKKKVLKKKFIIIWIILIIIFAISVLISSIQYSKYKKGQDLAIASMLTATDEFDEYKDNKKELSKKMYDYFNRDYYYYYYYARENRELTDKLIKSIRDSEYELEKILEKSGYTEGYHASYYFEHTNLISYYLDNYISFIIIYGIICVAVLLINIFYALSRKVKIIVSDDSVVYEKFTGKSKQFMIKDITSVETTGLSGLKILGNNIKVKTLLLKNNGELKNYIVDLISKKSNDNLKKTSIADELEKYKKLLDSGAITKEEYTKKKEKLLDL